MLNMTIAGRIGKDAELRRTPAGKSVASFSVAVDVGWGDNKKTQWIDCALWGERGEKLAQYLTKGSNVTVRGRPDVRAWVKNGEAGAAIQCHVDEVTLQGGGQKAAGNGSGQSGGYGGGYGNQPSPSDLDDDIPF